MSPRAAATAAGASLVLAAGLTAARRRRRRSSAIRLIDPQGPPTIDTEYRTRSVQAAELWWNPGRIAAACSPAGVERLARGYWSFLQRRTLGLIRVHPTPGCGLALVLLGEPLRLLSFGAPLVEPAADDRGGGVRWPITGGLLLARRGPTRHGSIEIALEPAAAPEPGEPGLEVRIAVVEFRPRIAELLGPRVYSGTQARIHVAVTRAFLRSLAGPDSAN